jgi:hypothetical protein
VGAYFFGEYCNNWISTYDPATDQVSGFATAVPHPLDMEVSADGSLHLLARDADNPNNGSVKDNLHRVTRRHESRGP